MKEGYKVVDRLSVPSHFDSLSEVELLIDNVCEKLSVNGDYYGNVLIAVTEAVNNAIQHGNKENIDVNVDLLVGDKDVEFCVNVRDHGSGFDYENLPDPTAPENLEKEDGRGIYLMKTLAEEVEFEEEGRSVNIYFAKN